MFVKGDFTMKRYIIKSRVRFLISVSIIIIVAASSFFTLKVNAKEKSEVILIPEYVEYGDTIWNLSKDYSGEMDIRDYIARVMDINGLDSASIKPGELLYFPDYN